MKWLLIALAGCSVSEAKDAAKLAPVQPCPMSVDPWSHELFPGCPTMPFSHVASCPRGACPKPCKVEAEGGGEKAKQTLTYDAGRWIAARGANSKHGLVDWSCTFTGGRMQRCEVAFDGNAVNQTSLKRDAKGRIIEIVDDEKASWTLSYDTAGRVSTIEAKHFREEYTYDRQGRLTRQSGVLFGKPHQTEFTYTGSLLDGGTSKYEYDARGRLTKVISKTPAGQRVDKLTFDAQDRLIELELGYTSPVVTRYTYCN